MNCSHTTRFSAANNQLILTGLLTAMLPRRSHKIDYSPVKPGHRPRIAGVIHHIQKPGSGAVKKFSRKKV
jgi:hypothetical protein